jgi:hypothetical protein
VAGELALALESPLPSSLPAGIATALFCTGTATDGEEPVADLELMAGALRVRADAVAMPRFDMPVRRSGFWAVVPVQVPDDPGGFLDLLARVTRRDGGAEEVVLGKIAIATPAARAEPASPGPAGKEADQDLIAVCMATFDPDLELLAAQLQSLRAQSDPRWVCVISDDHSEPERYAELERQVRGDERFVLARSGRRIGFYRNFERALMLAPEDAGLIALCDQDDVWHRDKLSVLRGSLGDAMLVYSDQRLVDVRGRVLRDTIWRGRANNWSSLASMLVANSVTGAGALMRREVAELALPFPDAPGIEFHDHWLALVALACGELRYVDRPLWDYVQHERAVLGKVALGSPPVSAASGPRRQRWRAAYFLGYLPGKVRAQALLLRCDRFLTPPKRQALARYQNAERSPLAFTWLVLRPLRALAGRTETLGTEWEIAPGIVWRWLAGALARARGLPARMILDTRFPDPPHFELRRLQRWRAEI